MNTLIEQQKDLFEKIVPQSVIDSKEWQNFKKLVSMKGYKYLKCWFEDRINVSYRSKSTLSYILWRMTKTNLFNDFEELSDFVTWSSDAFDYGVLNLFDFENNKPMLNAEEELVLLFAEEQI